MAGALKQAILAVGLGTIPDPQEHDALLLTTVHMLLGPQGFASQGFVQVFSKHISVPPQSSSTWHPKTQRFRKQICPRKQSLSTLHVSMQIPSKHFSLSAQFWSELQIGVQVRSTHKFEVPQSLSLSHNVGNRTHSISGFPVNPLGHVQADIRKYLK